MSEAGMKDSKKFVQGLTCWRGEVDPQPLSGGITNVNYVVEDGGEKFVVRVGNDIPLHQVMRFNELAASKAAYEAGLSPEVVFHTEGALVIRFIEGKTFDASDVQMQTNLGRILPLLHKCHYDMPKYVRGPALVFWVFHIVRDYAATLKAGNSNHLNKLADLQKSADQLETAVGSIEVVFGHNDLLPANLLDDGSRIWLLDWDYAGFNSPLFDLGGLASNNNLSDIQEKWMLEAYFDRQVTDELWRQYSAMKCASLLRETMWSMVSELHSEIDFDFAAYTEENLAGFKAALNEFNQI
ncbi:choline/ethanolamine kinase family protein [Curvivirga sp.]|uniref:choline/ethanolamine kinase family protein n=1 Tax=Curvivirga sp. TaxID=2856848 RepID=UPI003B5A3A91